MNKLKKGLAAGVAAAGLLLGAYSLSAKEQPLGVPAFMAMPQFFFLTGSPTPRPNVLYNLGTSLATTNATSYTYSNFDISAAPEDGNRTIVVVSASPGAAQGSTTMTIGGVSATRNISDSGCAIYSAVVPTGSTATIALSGLAATANYCVISVYAIYPASVTPVDTVQFGAGTLAAKTYTDVAVAAGGVLFYVCFSPAANVTHTQSWTGADSVVEDYDQNNIDSITASVNIGHIETTAASTTDDLTITRSAGGTNYQGCCASFGPQ